jgi:hypothetical protein
MMFCEKSFTKDMNSHTIQLDILCHFIIILWKDINVETVSRPFKQCGTSNLMENVEENLLWQDEGEAEVEVMSSDSNFDPYGDSLTCISACT